ncbi:GAF domain-containing sensor histidine kinase [Streptomyces sp. CC224B]|uniref:GAF domain-containing sensor histidine kinase n=1 Tax=Streptomyces sp. CC224B TaxID=3044571 RepID=UPI0024A80DEA|nr:GAF domain-containing sensor histidine kinase [Streptomyces sp. CC224B]
MAVSTTALTLPMMSAPRPEWHPWLVAIVEPVALMAYAYPGFLVARRQPWNRVGWLLLLSGFGGLLDAFGHAYTDYGLAHDLPGVAASGWVSNWAFAVNFFPVFFLLLCFPDGRLPGRRWRAVTWYVGLCGACVTAIASFVPGPVDRAPHRNVPNPMGVSWLAVLEQHEGAISLALVALPFLLATVSLLHRFLHSTGVTRQRFKWVALAALIDLVLAAGAMMFDRGMWLTVCIDLMPVILSFAIAVAIVCHRLFDVDWLLSRSLVYFGLTGCVVGLYTGTVALFGLVLRHVSPGAAALLATGATALALEPLRSMLQRAAGRLVYGLRDDPYTALANLSRRLETTDVVEKVLPTAASTVADAMRSPYVVIEMNGVTVAERRTRAANDTSGSPPLVRVALVHRNEEIGTLAVATRSAQEEFTPADLRLLRDTARHIAQAAANVRLSLEVRRSQREAVVARAEARRHLAMNLHDDIEPVLVGAARSVREATELTRADPDRARGMLAATLERVRRSAQDVRRLSFELRSPVNEVGLREAVLAYVDRVPMSVHTALPDQFPELPAAVEETVYRVLTGAVSNVLRHGGAARCWVGMEVDEHHVTLTVADDRTGLPSTVRPGPALSSLRACAAEVGGRCDLRARPGGGSECVARLPRRFPHGALPASREPAPLCPGVDDRDGDRAGGEP